MATIRESYNPIDLHNKNAGVWPEVVPPLTAAEAERAFRRLYRFSMGETYPGKTEISSGNRQPARFTWAGNYRLVVLNPEKGWKDFIHHLSHYFVDLCNGNEGHSKFHARFELKLVKEVIKRGWLDGKLNDQSKPEKPPVDPKVVKLERIESAIERWQRKYNRADRALAKLKRQQRYYTTH